MSGLSCLYHRLLLITCPSLADLTDINFLLTALDPLLFPGFNFDVQAHDGFVNEQAKYVRS